jgi:hypothetical protein
VPLLALSAPERQRILEALTRPRFADVTPYTCSPQIFDRRSALL